MAENILGGGYLPPAKPFNVINPSGVSSESALDTLLAVGEGRRNRAHQAQQSAAAMEFQQREAERERMFQGQQTQASQQFAEQQRLKSVQSEEYFRTREERFALMMKDQEDALSALDQEISLAVAQGQEGRAVELKKRQGELRQQLDEVSPRIQKLTLLKAAYDGMFSKDFTDGDGKSVGAQVLKNLSTLGVQKAQHFKDMQATLNGAITRLLTPKAPPPMDGGGGYAKDYKAAKPWGPVKQAISDAAGELSDRGLSFGPRAEDVLRTDPSRKTKKPAAGTPETEVAGPPSPEQPQVQTGGKWAELSTAVAATSAGKGDAKAIAVTVQTMLSALEQAVQNPSEVGGGPLMQKAVEQYKQAIAQGADQDNLDKALYAISTQLATAGSARAAIEGQKLVDAEGKGEVGQVSVSSDAVTLSKMIDWLQLQQDTDAQGKRSRLLKGYGNSDFFNFDTSEAKGDFAGTVMEVFSNLAGASNPEELLAVLTDGNPENDPQGLKFVNQLHPEVRDVILKDLSQAARDLQALREREGIDVADVGALPGLREQETNLLRQYDVDLPNEMAQSSHEDFTRLRGEVSRGREGVKKKKGEDRKRIDDDLEKARREVLGE